TRDSASRRAASCTLSNAMSTSCASSASRYSTKPAAKYMTQPAEFITTKGLLSCDIQRPSRFQVSPRPSHTSADSSDAPPNRLSVTGQWRCEYGWLRQIQYDDSA